MIRIGIIAIQHESNTFLSRSTTIDDFQADALLTGEDIRVAYADSRHEVGGFFHGLAEANMSAVPILLALATPSGVITHGAFDLLIKTMCDGLDRAGTLDGLLVAPHGAAVSEKRRDADGYWLKLLRERVGDIPIVCTLDPHANVSDQMIQACDATIAYRTNPHVDQYETGVLATELLARTLCGEIQPTQAIARPPIAISMDRQETAAQPCSELYKLADELLQLPNVISDSVILGFPYADVHEMGSSIVVVCDGDRTMAREHANRLALWLLRHRQDYTCQSISTDEAILEAAHGPTPVCLLDMGDNVGGGGPGDGTILAHALESADYRRSLVCLYDPQAVQKALDAGVGAKLLLSMGAKTDHLHGRPFVRDVTVVSQHNGRFTEPDVRHGGRTGYDMGPTAVVSTDLGTTVILTTHRVPPFSLKQVTSCGINPEDFQTIVAKGVNAPMAAYRDTCPRFIRVDTPGVTSADMLRLEFVHRRRPLFPFEDPGGSDNPAI
ncbi:M81 family metallopeptidase [Pirellulales bacterium]|nr:M81 family metallopeptidase [Pirellulales bacterium]